MPRIQCETEVELRGMLNPDGHGIEVRVFRPDQESSCVHGIFEAPYTGVDVDLPGSAVVSMQAPTLLVEACDVRGIRAFPEGEQGWEVKVEPDELFKVVDVQPEGTGLVLLVLQESSGRR